MKADLYTKIILTIIALCLTFNVLKDFHLVPNAHAGAPVDIPSVASLPTNLLKTNEDGSINVRLASASVVEVKPVYGATFDVKPASSSTEFTVKPASFARFSIEGDRYTPLYVTSDSYKPLYVKPYKDAVFKVEQTGSSIYSDEISTPISTYAYPNPASEKTTIVYSVFSQGEYITICNMDGKIMDHILLDPSQSELSLDLLQYASGIYLYNFNGNGGKFVVRK